MQKTLQQPIFYFLPRQKVFLRIITSQFIAAQQITPAKDINAVIQALKYRYPLNFLGEQYAKITVPCIPAKQPQIESHLQPKKQNERKLPPALLKVPDSCKGEGAIQGFASGKRSAIVQMQGCLYRYKGCGNLIQGFPVSNDELRGCHFLHTAKRQLMMTQQINQLLQKQLAIDSANSPLCMYQFGRDEINSLGLKNELDLLQKFSCIFLTEGDRRAGTHLISPLELLYLGLCQINQVNWLQIFKHSQRLDQGEPIEFLPLWMFLEPGESFLPHVLDKLSQPANFISFQKIDVKNVSEAHRQKMFEKIKKKFLLEINQQNFIENFFTHQGSQINFKQLIQTLSAKVAFEMGEIKRIFCQHGLNWGYFNDHGNTWHCNAHLNNFVITVPEKDAQFLLPLDFDLAFFRQEFISIDLAKEKNTVYGHFDGDTFENYLCAEYQAMEMSISGMEMMSNFDYSLGFDGTQSGPLSSHNLARIAFRDHLLQNFRAGMKRDQEIKQEIHRKWNRNIQSFKGLVKVCLLISQQFQT